MILRIIDVKNPILRQVAKPVVKIDKKIKNLISDMRETLASQKDPEGVGLAASQVGKSFRIFIIKYKNIEKIIINPEVLEVSQGKVKKVKEGDREILEGCLSLPHYYGPINRASKIKISYLNEHEKKVIEEFSDFNAQIVQHEIDHLNGTLFVDKILEQKAPLYKMVGEEWEEVELK